MTTISHHGARRKTRVGGLAPMNDVQLRESRWLLASSLDGESLNSQVMTRKR